LYELITRGKRELDHISNYCPFLENDKVWSYEADSDVGAISEQYQQGFEAINHELYNTHLWWDNVPQGNPDARYIYVYRKPRDACASFFHHLVHMKTEEGGIPDDVNSFVQDWCDNKVVFGGWADHLNSWLGEGGTGSDNRVLVLSYEDMKKDLESVLKRIVKHCKIECSDEEIVNDVMPHLTLQHMKSNVDRYEPKSVSWVGKGDGFQFIRNGTGAKNLFEESHEEVFKKYLIKNAVPVEL